MFTHSALWQCMRWSPICIKMRGDFYAHQQGRELGLLESLALGLARYQIAKYSGRRSPYDADSIHTSDMSAAELYIEVLRRLAEQDITFKI